MLKKIYTDTAVEEFRFHCPFGHSFVAEVVVAVHIDSDLQLLDKIMESGFQSIACPICHHMLPIAHPIFVHSSKRKKCALFVPQSMNHIQWQLMGTLLQLFGAYEGEKIQEYMYHFITVSSKQQLLLHLQGCDAVGMPTPPIHSAFADLASVIPEPQAATFTEETNK